MPNAARLRVFLLEIDPEPWRRIEVPLSLSLKGLHDCIQAAFLWNDSHLWQFEVGESRYSDVMQDFGGFGDPVRKASRATLGEIVESGAEPVVYLYDMGDDWAHLIEVEALFDADPDVRYPRYLDGEWAAPPDDCGGAPGFENLKEALADPNHPDHEELSDWLDGPFDPAFVNQEQVVALMDRIARRRRKKP